MDVMLATTALVVLAVPMAVIALLVRSRMGRPVFFCQDRPGLGGHTIRVRKFRTMRPGAPHDPARVTPLGRVLRRWSLDELPQLVGVVTGDLSLVGPRPLLPSYLEHYDDEQRRRHDVRPGLTGLAQVAGREALSWDDSLALDVAYVEEWSMLLDLKILALTVWQLLSASRAASDSDLSRPEFGAQPSPRP